MLSVLAGVGTAPCFRIRTESCRGREPCSCSQIPSGGNGLGLSLRLELLCGRDRVKSWCKSLGSSCSHWGKHLLFMIYLYLCRWAEAGAACGDEWTWSPQTSPRWGCGAFGLKDLPVENRITNTPRIWRRKNICSNPRASIFHKSARVSFSFSANKKKIRLDWSDLHWNKTKIFLRFLFPSSVFPLSSPAESEAKWAGRQKVIF